MRRPHWIGRNCEAVVDGKRCGRWVPSFALECAECGSDVSTAHVIRAAGELTLSRMLDFFTGSSKHDQHHDKPKLGMRRVVETRTVGVPAGNVLLVLDCGHAQKRKQSKGIPKTAKCASCGASA